VARIVPYAAIHFFAYERFRASIVDALAAAPPTEGFHNVLPSNNVLPSLRSGTRSEGCPPEGNTLNKLLTHPPVWVDFVAGSAAGSVAVATTYPLDLVRTRLAWSMEHSEAAGSNSIRSTFQVLLQTEGVAGLYRVCTSFPDCKIPRSTNFSKQSTASTYLEFVNVFIVLSVAACPIKLLSSGCVDMGFAPTWLPYQ
jgi:hypothetical protein